jgi:hypothetical protein
MLATNLLFAHYYLLSEIACATEVNVACISVKVTNTVCKEFVGKIQTFFYRDETENAKIAEWLSDIFF